MEHQGGRATGTRRAPGDVPVFGLGPSDICCTDAVALAATIKRNFEELGI